MAFPPLPGLRIFGAGAGRGGVATSAQLRSPASLPPGAHHVPQSKEGRAVPPTEAWTPSRQRCCVGERLCRNTESQAEDGAGPACCKCLQLADWLQLAMGFQKGGNPAAVFQTMRDLEAVDARVVVTSLHLVLPAVGVLLDRGFEDR